ncbi:MAG: alanyl-tRNA editing protein [Acidobacteriia bacterium]|nr:alanyl-tRNA editing protein [Terriglobia bacterium]
MPTERLYYGDSFLRSFEAQIADLREMKGQFHVVLDRTAFYPTGGGQPNDRGTLNGVEVVDVFEQEGTGEVIHVISSAVRAGRAVGEVDWPRRFDHMQQHTGQHIFSAAFIQMCEAPTVGFHLGLETSTIDLRTNLAIPERLEEVVNLANQIVFEDREVAVLNVSRGEAAAMHLRKESDREGVLRIIEVTGFDRTPCGGTHVTRTGQIGLIAPRKVERYKQGWRVEFVCGGRALRRSRDDFDTLARASKLLSSPVDQIPGVIERQIEESKSSRRERSRLLEELASFKAMSLLQGAKSCGGRRLLIETFRNEGLDYLKMLAQHAVAESRVVVFFVLAGEKPQVLIATSPDSGVDASQLFKVFGQEFSLRGGGSRHLAQGSLADASAVAPLIESAEKKLTAM